MAYILLLAAASAIAGTVSFQFSNEPAWASDAAGVEANVRVNGVSEISGVRVHYTYPGGKTGVADAQHGDGNQFHIKIPATVESGPGKLTYFVEVPASAGKAPIRSETRTIPLALEKELDITGDAAVALLYPLGGPEYTVRYVPCCNIFGGITIATRLSVNPEQTNQGLPEKILSNFLVLKPDGLSASTMGMYMDFFLPMQFDGVTPALYEFNGREWVEFSDYKVDAARGYLSMHCPDGGTFVIAAKL